MARSPSERLAMACRMFAAAKTLVQAGIEQECGEQTPHELRRRMFLRMYGKDFTETEQERIADSLAV